MMHAVASKRRLINVISLSFVSKLFSKKFLIKSLKRDNQLQLFRRLERSSEKLINTKCALEFIQLCQNFDLTPTFAKVECSKAEKWKQSAKKYEQNVIAEELSEKKRLMREQKNEVTFSLKYGKIIVLCARSPFCRQLRKAITKFMIVQ
jgi:hypothetical protein